MTSEPNDRAFLDANILFSAARHDEAPMRRLWRLPDVRLLTSDYAVEEVERNLPQARRGSLVELLTSVILVPVPPHEAWMIPPSIVLPDKDRPILAAAIHSGATHLLTGDSRHFGRHYGQTIEGVLVLPPADYPFGRQGHLTGNTRG